MSFGGSSNSDSTTNSSSQTVNMIPQWVQDAGKQNYAYAQSLANQPLQQYQGQMVADTAPQMQQAWDLAANSGNVGQQQYNAANAGYLGTLGTTPQQVNPQTLAKTNLNPYMNPYTQDVINKTLPIMQQNLGLQQLGVANNATQNNAFGGSRMGVEQGVTQAQGAMNMAQMAAGLNQANFQQAQAGATGDITRNLTAQQLNQAAGLQQEMLNNQASAGLTGLGDSENKSNIANYEMLTNAGASQQQTAQQQINAQMAKYAQAQQYPYQGLGLMELALGQTPYNTASSTNSTSNTQSQQSQSPDWSNLITQGLGALSNVFQAGAFGSDRRMKTDITPMGKDPTTGIKMHAFRYKGDPKSYPKVVGPMAQDVAKTMPGAVKPVGALGRLTVATPVMGALTPPISGGYNTGLKMAGKLATAATGATTNPRAGARGVRGALANTKRRLPGIAGALR